MFINLHVIEDEIHNESQYHGPVNVDKIRYISPYGSRDSNSRIVFSEVHSIVVEESMTEVYDLIERKRVCPKLVR